jgi:hypothetical protein
LTQEMNEPKAGGESVSGQMKQQAWADIEAWWGWWHLLNRVRWRWCDGHSGSAGGLFLRLSIARFVAMRSIRGKSTFSFCGDREEEGGYIVYLSPEGLKKSTFPLSLEFDYNRYKSALEAHDSHCLDSKYNNQHVPRSNW